MIKNLNKKPKELELKYIIEGNEENFLDRITNIFTSNGFKIVSTAKMQNNDEYFDTEDLVLYQNGGSLRIREITKNNKIEIKGTYKIPIDKDEIYISRIEIEETLTDSSFDSFETKMNEKEISVNFNKIIKTPILNSITKRTDIIFEKDKTQVCLSLDNITYIKHLNKIESKDKMIEIEIVGQLNNKIILNEIHKFLIQKIKNLIIIKQSKYQRGIDSTSI